MGPGRRPTQNLRFSESRSVMKSKFRPILAPALLALLAAGCAGNVRWRHPAPDEALLRQMLSDINGFHVTGHGGREDDTLLSPERARAILARQQVPDEDTPPFQFTEVSGRVITIRGYGQFIPAGDLSQPRRRHLYHYRGELTHAAYALRHMAPAACDLRLYTKPQALEFTWIDGSAGHGVTQAMEFDGELSANCQYVETEGNGSPIRYDILQGYQPYARKRGRVLSIKMF